MTLIDATPPEQRKGIVHMARTAGSATGSIYGLLNGLLNGLLIGLVCLLPMITTPCLAQNGEEAEPEADPILTGAGGGLADPAAADTVRTNLWLVEALMGEIAAEGALALPDPPGTVRLEALSDAGANTLFRVVAANVLDERGYDVVLPRTAPEDPLPAADSIFRYDVVSIDLVYPEVGRTLGIWKRWVSRSVEVTCTVEVVDDASGKLLMGNRITRGFHDRLDQNFFDDVNSDVYDFTSADTSESGWKRRTEELVVLGTLVGLIAVYFANTGQ